MANILLLGAKGQLGRELNRSLLPLGNVLALTRKVCDLTNKEYLIEIIRKVQPEIIVNAAAYTAVDKAESDEEMARLINYEVPVVLSEEARRNNSLLVDYSTDYVFDGCKQGPYIETDTPNPLNVYGRTKLAGLNAIQQSGCRFLVFRISGVYSRFGRNFVKTMMKMGKERKEIKVVSNQIGVPTPADLVADITAQALLMLRNGKGKEGLYNLVPKGDTSWYGVAHMIFQHLSEISSFDRPELVPVSTDQFVTAATRPLNSRLTSNKIEDTFGFVLPDWQVPLTRIISEYIVTCW